MDTIDTLIEHLLREGITEPWLLAAFRNIPREAFLPGKLQNRSYENRAFPIDCGQTISQPTMIALMLRAGAIRPGMNVLDVGTGSGYQAAILASAGATVTTIECIEALSVAAEGRLAALGLPCTFVVGDGSLGVPARAPYDAILVAAAAPAPPPPLLAQLGPHGGKLVIPVRKSAEEDMLEAWERRGEDFRGVNYGPCKFVPLTGEYGLPPVQG